MTPEERIAQVEADRRKRERQLLALLLLMMEETRQHAQSAVKLGHDPVEAASNVIYGKASIDQPGVGDDMLKLMDASYQDGADRVADWAGVTLDPGIAEKQASGRNYADYVRTALKSLYDAVTKKIRGAVAAGVDKGTRGTIQLVREGLKQGFSAVNDSGLALPTEQAVVTSYNGGMWAGYNAPNVVAKLIGFRHCSVLDSHTTEICHTRNLLTLKRTNAFWLTSYPPLHWNCRSVLLPIFEGEPFVESTELPTIPPTPGFGVAPIWVFLSA